MNTSDRPMLALEGVTKVFLTDEVETHALAGIHLNINRGEFVSIAGPSGCGKSTLLSILGLLDSPSDGNYWLDGKPVADLPLSDAHESETAKRISFFKAQLDRRLTVYENVELPLPIGGFARLSGKTAPAPARTVGMGIGQSICRSALRGRTAMRSTRGPGARDLLRERPESRLGDGEAVMSCLGADQQGTICMVTHDQRYAAHADRSVHLFDGRVIEEVEERTMAMKMDA